MKTVKNLVLGVGIFDAVGKWKLPPLVSVDELQQRGFTTARIASSIAGATKFADTAYMAGLVCDVGELVLAAALPDQLQEAWQLAAKRGAPRLALEHELLGATHAEVGACLLGLWGLPFSVVEAVAGHHMPSPSPQSGSDLPSIVGLASSVACGEAPNPDLVAHLGGPQMLERARALRSANQ